MSDTILINDDRLSSAFAVWAGNGRRGLRAAGRFQLRLLVRDTIRITPPNMGTMSKVAGEKRIRRELNGIMRESRSPVAEDPAAIHARYRRRRGGRVLTNLRRENSDGRHHVRGLRPYIETVLKLVGLLAAGWLAAAQSLGLNVPPWIARHGSGHGRYIEAETLDGIRFRVENRVPFAGAVAGLRRRFQAAADNRAIQMEKQTARYLFGEGARKAGFKVAA